MAGRKVGSVADDSVSDHSTRLAYILGVPLADGAVRYS
jgi:hypothetical protein